MSTFTYLVTVETERDNGLIASRDEQSESITAEIEQAIDGHQIDGIGARSDSEYSVVGVDIQELDKKSERALRDEYDQHVAEAAPSNADLRRELKGAMAARSAMERELQLAQRRIRDLEDKQKQSKSRIFQQRHYGAPKVYLDDSTTVYFQYGAEDEHERFAVNFSQHHGGITIRSEAFAGGRFGAFPESSNVLRVEMVER